MEITIRPYTSPGAAATLAVYKALFPQNQPTLPAWQGQMQWVQANGRAWVLAVAEKVVGYTAVLPVPGLPGLVELEGGILPGWQRQGLGGRLLQHLVGELAGTAVRQLSVAVPALDTPAARFLIKHRFFVEHEEQMMTRSLALPLPARPPAASQVCRSYPRAEAITHFLRLYQASFGGTPWDQPFSRAEVAADLTRAEDLQFLVVDETPVGFVWVRREEAGVAKLEPIGILPAAQGRGHGRWLLTAVLHQLAAESIHTVKLGVWAGNETATALYRRLGFTYTASLYYLAFNLPATA